PISPADAAGTVPSAVDAAAALFHNLSDTARPANTATAEQRGRAHQQVQSSTGPTATGIWWFSEKSHAFRQQWRRRWLRHAWYSTVGAVSAHARSGGCGVSTVSGGSTPCRCRHPACPSRWAAPKRNV